VLGVAGGGCGLAGGVPVCCWGVGAGFEVGVWAAVGWTVSTKLSSNIVRMGALHQKRRRRAIIAFGRQGYPIRGLR